MAQCPKPVIAAVHGYCIGGGVDLIAACDIRLASADAIFSVREAKVAIVADLGSLQRLPAIIGAGHLAELAFTGKDIDAARAKEIGLVNDVAADAEAAALEAATSWRARSPPTRPIAVQGTKAVLAANEGRTVAEGLDYVATWNAGMLASDDLVEAMIGLHGAAAARTSPGARRREPAAQRAELSASGATSGCLARSRCGRPRRGPLGQDAWRDVVDDVLDRVQERGDFRAAGSGLVLEGRLDQAPVHPADIGQTAMVRGAVLRAAPGCLGRQVELAEAGRLTRGVGPALEVGAFLTHRHATMVPRHA